MPKNQTMEDIQHKGCGGCMLRDHCTIQEDDGISCKQRWKAIILAYIVPFLILVAAIVGFSFCWDNDYKVGGAALGCVAIYYAIIYLIKPKI